MNYQCPGQTALHIATKKGYDYYFRGGMDWYDKKKGIMASLKYK